MGNIVRRLAPRNTEGIDPGKNVDKQAQAIEEIYQVKPFTLY